MIRPRRRVRREIQRGRHTSFSWVVVRLRSYSGMLSELVSVMHFWRETSVGARTEAAAQRGAPNLTDTLAVHVRGSPSWVYSSLEKFGGTSPK